VAALRPVVFDLDGVLVDSEPLYERAFASFLKGVGRSDAADLFALTLGRREVDFLPALAARLELHEEDVRRELHRATGAVICDLRPMPFATEVFASLYADGRSLAIATSRLAPFAEQAMQQLRIESMVDALVSGEDVTEGKPDPSIYRLAASRIGAEPSACIAVEDTPAGVAAASAAGMTCIAIPHALSPRADLGDADVIADDLRAAATAVRRLDRRGS
jgi:mannitol-1-/sugar-/sorbitol-6-/2-deoxyglucose-6-phosphatase